MTADSFLSETIQFRASHSGKDDAFEFEAGVDDSACD